MTTRPPPDPHTWPTTWPCPITDCDHVDDTRPGSETHLRSSHHLNATTATAAYSHLDRPPDPGALDRARRRRKR